MKSSYTLRTSYCEFLPNFLDLGDHLVVCEFPLIFCFICTPCSIKGE
jgi:hypothetical protein